MAENRPYPGEAGTVVVGFFVVKQILCENGGLVQSLTVVLKFVVQK